MFLQLVSEVSGVIAIHPPNKPNGNKEQDK